MNTDLLPSGRPIEDMDLAAAVSLARQFVAAREKTQTENQACRLLAQLLQLMDASVARAHGPLLFDRALVADMLRFPVRHRQVAILCQAALVHGTLGEDTPRQTDTLIPARRRSDHVDDGA